MFPPPGTSWWKSCRAIRDITGAPAFGWDNLAGSFMTLLLQNGGRYTDQNGNLYFATEDSDITLKVLQMWQDNVNEGIWRTAGGSVSLRALCQ